MIKIIDRKIITEKSGELIIPDYCFGVADDETKTGWLLIFLLSNYKSYEPKDNILKDARDIISYCNVYSKKHKTVEIKHIMCTNANKINYLAIDVEEYGRSTKRIVFDSIAKAFSGYTYNIGTKDTDIGNAVIQYNSGYLYLKEK